MLPRATIHVSLRRRLAIAVDRYLELAVGIVATLVCVAAYSVLVLLMVCSCSTVESIEPRGDTSACERVAMEHGAQECGVVYQCARRIDGEFVELCIRAEDLPAAELENGRCWPSRDDRFDPYALAMIDPPCFWRCDGRPGCNATSGCWGCPLEAP